jgi:hypothetical protein
VQRWIDVRHAEPVLGRDIQQRWRFHLLQLHSWLLVQRWIDVRHAKYVRCGHVQLSRCNVLCRVYYMPRWLVLQQHNWCLESGSPRRARNSAEVASRHRCPRWHPGLRRGCLKHVRNYVFSNLELERGDALLVRHR